MIIQTFVIYFNYSSHMRNSNYLKNEKYFNKKYIVENEDENE